MSSIKKFFPLTAKPKYVKSLVIAILIYIVASAVVGVLLGILSIIPLVGLITGIVGTLVELYCLAGIVLAILDYLEVKLG